MSNANLGWLFYRDYFRDIDYDDIGGQGNETRIKSKVENILRQSPQPREEELLGNVHFKATTTYPGLLLGSGNAHELPSIEGQAILGFHFDYTTGLPVIPGSSIKGVLRSAFEHPEYIKELLNGKDIDIEELEKEIFDNGDLFFDATVVKVDSRLLGDDFLTPHDESGLKNPIPLRFIKVMPGVSFVFDFILYDGILDKQEKRTLFEKILEDLGLGAKTNVGYGKFENFSSFKTVQEREAEERERAEKLELEKREREEEERKKREEKAKKAAEGINALLDCKTTAEGFKLLKELFGVKPKPTAEQKKVIEQFYKKQKNLSKGDKKTFKKYGLS